MNILFITHDASRSGAPILLRNFMGWMKRNTNHEFQLLCRVGGSLESDFKSHADVKYFYPKHLNNPKTVLQRIINRIGYYKYRIKKHHRDLFLHYKKQDFDLIYSNTVVNTDVLVVLKKLDVPVLTHVRELESTIEHFGGKYLIRELDKYTDKFVADSYAVKKNLVDQHNVVDKKIDVIYEYVEVPEKLPDTEITSTLKSKLEIPEDAFIVGASGGGLWRKGYDLFIQAAVAICNKEGNENVYFLWVGGFKEDKEAEIRFDIHKAGLKDRILFVGSQKKPLDYFSLFDVFVLASREEPFGIVGMESALFETPIICFNNSGGMPEFITEECGIAVPYLNIPKLVEAILFFKHNPKLREQYGRNAKNKVLTQHTLEVKSKELLKIMENQLW
ncbi:glycosyltransferase family 4 protein [Rhodohalobacter sp. 8-1]|uniref:glycosyltransferase family 4 protein n=1 Tax=Rhodohalobacter sp. 8-1 TaxID=3131972 RepID=UPI0030EB6B93